MLTKVTDDLFIDFDEIVLLKKEGKEIAIHFKSIKPVIIVPSLTTEGKRLLRTLRVIAEEKIQPN